MMLRAYVEALTCLLGAESTVVHRQNASEIRDRHDLLKRGTVLEEQRHHLKMRVL